MACKLLFEGRKNGGKEVSIIKYIAKQQESEQMDVFFVSFRFVSFRSFCCLLFDV